MPSEGARNLRFPFLVVKILSAFFVDGARGISFCGSAFIPAWGQRAERCSLLSTSTAALSSSVAVSLLRPSGFYRTALHSFRVDGPEETFLAEFYEHISPGSSETNFANAGFVDTAASAALSPLRPESIRVVPLNAVKQPCRKDFDDAHNFVMNVRAAGPYLHMHAGQSMVVHISSSLLGSAEFDHLMDDLGLIKMLGVQLVLVMSTREQVDRRLDELGKSRSYCGDVRVTDGETLQVIKEMSGIARAEVERRLSRSRANGCSSGVDVISGNFFFTAQPYGVRRGVDFGYTGEVRRVDAASMAKRLRAGDVILLTTLGYAPSGEAYTVLSESLAAETAAALGASKLLWVTDGHSFISDETGDLVQCMRLSDANALLEHYALESTSNATLLLRTQSSDVPAMRMGGGELSPQQQLLPEEREEGQQQLEAQQSLELQQPPRRRNGRREDWQQCRTLDYHNPPPAPMQDRPTFSGRFEDSATAQLVNLVRFSVSALRRGVTRAHLVAPTSGDLLRELYTSDGAGTLISRDLYDGIRRATDGDVVGILEIIEPLVEEGILVRRTVTDIQKNLEHTYVFVRDGDPVACGMLIPYGPAHAEISCLAVKPKYRGRKRGDAMLTFLERVAVGLGIPTVFVLSTRTLEFFAERGFTEAPHTALPDSRAYDLERRSRVFLKQIHGTRELDMEELFWMDESTDDGRPVEVEVEGAPFHYLYGRERP
jgi:amino-acid N-acetyltransferase